MMKKRFLPRAGLALIFLAVTPIEASTIAYMDPADVGNQVWTGNLGEDFTVNSPIQITALGVYDSGQTGDIGGTLEVAIFASDGTQETPTVVFSGTTGTLIGGDLFQNLATPITLGPGDYSLTTTGWDGNILDGNANCVSTGCGLPPAPYLPPALNSGGGAITFTGVGYNATPGLAYVGPVAPYPANQFDAGSFQFNPTSVPEPATLAGVTLGLVALLAAHRRAVKR